MNAQGWLMVVEASTMSSKRNLLFKTTTLRGLRKKTPITTQEYKKFLHGLLKLHVCCNAANEQRNLVNILPTKTGVDGVCPFILLTL